MKINFALDGTFCHDRGAHNIEEALKHGFDVNLFLINQEPEKLGNWLRHVVNLLAALLVEKDL